MSKITVQSGNGEPGAWRGALEANLHTYEVTLLFITWESIFTIMTDSTSCRSSWCFKSIAYIRVVARTICTISTGECRSVLQLLS